MYKQIFNRVKRIIPKISETEIIALKSGGVSIDREIFNGCVNISNLYGLTPIKIQDKIMEKKTEQILRNIGNQNVYPNKNINMIMEELANSGLLGMIIDKKYGGNRLSITEQSKLLTKLSSYNPSLAVTAMVPNSLGPAELLQHYGTEQQKEYFLPKLANGSRIPCFGLTGPNNGSDAVGSIDKGKAKKINGKTKIEISLNKRYITLAPVSNLIGIAFNLEDPDKLIGKTGITLALVESDQKGLIKNTYHNPNNAGFPNGTIKGTIQIDPNQIIGGSDGAGEGWKMLMECLAVGRGISLPATANGSSKFITQSILNYINIRKQFNMNIGNMEAVKEKFIDMYINTWIIHCGVNLTNTILDKGQTPSVITAIMKQQTTERARNILNNGMDIYAGSAICVGENNFFTKFYNSSPVGITVEGSNTLTRGLIIFGQGLNKSHPYIYPIFQSIQDENIQNFESNFNKLVYGVITNYLKILNPFNLFVSQTNVKSRLEIATLKFSVLSNFVAMMGGKIKSKQMISGNMSDILSNLYLSYSLLWYHNLKDNKLDFLRDQSIGYLLNDIDYKMNLIISNYPSKVIKALMCPLKNKIKYPVLEDKNNLYKMITGNTDLDSIFKEDIFYEGTVLEKMEKIRKMDPNSQEYKNLYQEIIQVGEYKF